MLPFAVEPLLSTNVFTHQTLGDPTAHAHPRGDQKVESNDRDTAGQAKRAEHQREASDFRLRGEAGEGAVSARVAPRDDGVHFDQRQQQRQACGQRQHCHTTAADQRTSTPVAAVPERFHDGQGAVSGEQHRHQARRSDAEKCRQALGQAQARAPDPVPERIGQHGRERDDDKTEKVNAGEATKEDVGRQGLVLGYL